MNPQTATIRVTFFTNKPIEVDYEKSMKIVANLSAYQLFPFPVNGFSFQIGPAGMTPITMTGYEFRNSDNSLNISIGPDRVDINQCKNYSNIEMAFNSMLEIYKSVSQAFHGCLEFKETRLAIASTWIIPSVDMRAVTSSFIGDNNVNLIEWENRRVERKTLESIGVPVNYGSKIARGFLKLPIEPLPMDRIFVETDVNTVPLLQDYFDVDKSIRFFEDALRSSVRIITALFEKVAI